MLKEQPAVIPDNPVESRLDRPSKIRPSSSDTIAWNIDPARRSPHIDIMRIGRLVIVLFALIGLFGQSVTVAMASTPSQTGAATQMMTMAAAECSQMAKMPHQRGDQSPCDKECLAKMGCGAASILATRSPMLSVTERYHDTAYFAPQSCLSGVEVEPEIFPPIA